MSLCACCCPSTNDENPTGTDVLRKGTCEGAEWDNLPGHESCRGIELSKHPLEGRRYGRRSRVAADDFIQGSNDRVVGDVHVGLLLKRDLRHVAMIPAVIGLAAGSRVEFAWQRRMLDLSLRRRKPAPRGTHR